MRTRSLLGAISICLAAWPAAAFAQEDKPQDKPPPPAEEAAAQPATEASAQPAEAGAGDKPVEEKPEKPAEKKGPDVIEVSVLGHSDDALQKIPGGGTLVGAKEIRRAQPQDSGEILRRVPGLHVRPEEGAGLRLNLGMRGLDPTRSRQVLVLEDGMPVAINPYGEPDLYYSTPVERIRAVEIVKGSGSILFGPQTIGGVVNFLTITPPDKTEWAVDVLAGQRNTWKLLGNYGSAVGDTRYVAQVMHKQSDGIRGFGYNATDFLGKVAIPTSEHGDAMIKLAVYDELSRSTYVGLSRSMYELDPRRASIAPYDAFLVRRYDASITHEYRFSEATTLRTFVYGYITNRAWRRQNYDRAEQDGIAYQRIVGDRSTPGGAVYFRDTATIRDRSYQALGVEPKFEHRFATGNVRHTLTLGARGHVETAERLQYLTGFATSNAGALESEEYHRSYAAAAYVQDRLAFRSDLLVTPGVRMEYVQSLRQIRRTSDGGPARDVWIRGETSSLAFMPGIGMVYGTPKLSIFGGIHVGYAPPRVSAAISTTGADAHLEAEQSTNYEVGVRLAKPRWLRAEVTGFVMSFRNQIVTGTLASGQQSELVNGGQTEHRGVESSVSLAIGKALSLPVEIDLTGRYTYSLATFHGGPFDGNRLPYAPLSTASVVLDVDHKIGLGGEVALTYVSDQFADEANTVAVDPTGRLGLVPAYKTVDLGLRYKHPKTGLGASLSVKNALDQVFVATRLPDGIHTGGFRQVNLAIRWDHK